MPRIPTAEFLLLSLTQKSEVDRLNSRKTINDLQSQVKQLISFVDTLVRRTYHQDTRIHELENDLAHLTNTCNDYAEEAKIKVIKHKKFRDSVYDYCIGMHKEFDRHHKHVNKLGDAVKIIHTRMLQMDKAASN